MHHVRIDRQYNAKASHLSDSDLHRAAQALHEKAERDDKNADELERHGHKSLVAQFRRQAADARTLAERLENAESGLLVVDTAGD